MSKYVKPLRVLLSIVGLLIIGACSGGGGGSSSTPITPAPAPSFSYNISGTAIKGVVSGAEASLIDSAGNSVGSTTMTNASGDFELTFNSPAQLTVPLQLLIRNVGSAQSLCDSHPVCESGLNNDGLPMAVGFGELYDLPTSFQMRAAIEDIQDDGNNSFSSTVYVSPLSEFVISAALGMGDGTSLTQENLDIANDRVATLLVQIYPDVGIPIGFKVAAVGLVDLTDLAGIQPENVNPLNLAMSTVAASIAAFVDPANSSRSDIMQVMDDFSLQILNNVQTDFALSSNHDTVILAQHSTDELEIANTELGELVGAGTVALPEGVGLEDFTLVQTGGAAILPEIIEFCPNLLPTESTHSLVDSSATGWAELLLLPETGEVTVSLETAGIVAGAVHLHQAYAGQSGGVVVPLEQDAGNENRWQFAEGTVLDESTIAAIMRGETYLNVHSAAYPGGELRGQLVPTGIKVTIVTPNGGEQVPRPVQSNGFAKAAITLDQATNMAQVHISTTDLTAVAAHVHSNLAGTNGGVVIPLSQDPNNTSHWLAVDVDMADMLTALDTAQLYFNLHTSANPAGELRGQVVPMGYEVRISSMEAVQVVAETAVVSDATGVSALTVQLSTGTFSAHVNTQDLIDPLAVHIHAGAVGVNGGVVQGLTRDSLDPGHWSAAGTFSTAELMMFLNEELYMQAHTSAYQGGEIRGQLGGFEDADGDGVTDSVDAFPNDPTESVDSDADGVGDNGDNCPNTANANQEDTDEDGIGDACDEAPDADGDGVPDSADAFPNDPAESVDSDSDGVGDNGDNCPNVSNPNQEDVDEDGIGDACDDPPAPTFAAVQSIFNSRCVGCHGGASPAAGLSLTSAYDNIVNVPSSQISSMDRIEPGDPNMSYLVWKIEGRSGITGSQMPLGGVLPAADIQTIVGWVEAGANP